MTNYSSAESKKRKLFSLSTQFFSHQSQSRNTERSVLDVLGLHLNESSKHLKGNYPEQFPWQNNLSWKCYGIFVGTKHDVQIVKNYCQAFYVPGEFCRQSEVIDALSEQIEFELNEGIDAHKVYLERGAFLSPADLLLAYEKFSSIARKQVVLVDAGTSFGGGDIVFDLSAFTIYKQRCSANLAINTTTLRKNFELKYRWQSAELLKNFEMELRSVVDFFSIEEVFSEHI